jgi:hypothetical protein
MTPWIAECTNKVQYKLPVAFVGSWINVFHNEEFIGVLSLPPSAKLRFQKGSHIKINVFHSEEFIRVLSLPPSAKLRFQKGPHIKKNNVARLVLLPLLIISPGGSILDHHLQQLRQQTCLFFYQCN